MKLGDCEHDWGEWKIDINEQLFRICKICHVVDESKRTEERCI